MADPRRYYIDPVLVIQDGSQPRATTVADESPSGDWIKYSDFVDYKAAQRRNKSEEAVIRLGVEVAQLRAEIAELKSRG